MVGSLLLLVRYFVWEVMVPEFGMILGVALALMLYASLEIYVKSFGKAG